MELPRRVSVKALLRNGDDILVLRESKGDNSGKFHFPGGHTEGEESLEEALRREVRQETGIEQMDIGLPYYVCEWPARLGGELIRVVGIFYPCRTEERSVTLSHEHDQELWMAPLDYSQHPMVSHSDQIIERYLELERLGGLRYP
jgi:8-oxo-dGTP diphosphatase